jgi:hypothetical protein
MNSSRNERRDANERQAPKWDTSVANAEALLADPLVSSGLEQIISARLGRRVRHLRGEPILKDQANPRRTRLYRRAYTKHWLKITGPLRNGSPIRIGDDRQLVVLSKSAVDLAVCPPLESILNANRDIAILAPYFWGCFEASGVRIAAWEWLEWDRVPFKNQSRESRTRIVEAIARLNAIDAHETVPALTKWVDIPLRWFERRFRGMNPTVRNEFEQLNQSTCEIMKHKEKLVRRLLATGETFLTHNDIGPGASNVLVTNRGEVMFCDWGSATLSVAGADLRALAVLREENNLLCHYIEKMAEHGIRLSSSDVRFNYQVLEGFRCLRNGWREENVLLIKNGLDLLRSHI